MVKRTGEHQENSCSENVDWFGPSVSAAIVFAVISLCWTFDQDPVPSNDDVAEQTRIDLPEFWQEALLHGYAVPRVLSDGTVKIAFRDPAEFRNEIVDAAQKEARDEFWREAIRKGHAVPFVTESGGVVVIWKETR